MKKVLIAVALLGMFLVGCQDANNSNITGPVTSLEKTSILSNLLNAGPTVTKTIDGAKGGTIYLTGNSVRGLSASSVVASVEFAPGAFDGKKSISVSADFNDASLSFSPHMVFNGKDLVKLNATFTGINLDLLGIFGNNKDNIAFCYFADDSSCEVIRNSGIGLNILLSQISVKDAMLEHFSRYGWSTKE